MPHILNLGGWGIKEEEENSGCRDGSSQSDRLYFNTPKHEFQFKMLLNV
jgi:hypothetical protein